MKPDTALKHFKTREAMRVAADCSRQAVDQWFDAGLIPRRSARLLAAMSGGKLKVDPKLYE